jgi:hypothetical protein
VPAADVVDLIKSDHRERLSREDLEHAARNAGFSGVSSSSKKEIKEDLLEHAQQSGE